MSHSYEAPDKWGKYQFILDPGHGWLRVPKETAMGMTLSTYSFSDGEFLYLEEDVDASVFIDALGLTPGDWELRIFNEPCFVRGLQRLRGEWI